MLLGLSLLGATAGSVPLNSYAQSNADNFELTVAVKNPLGDKKEFKDILSSVLKAIMDIVLPVVIVMVIYSGFLYVVARGNPDAISKAHKTLTWTLIGAAILLGAQLIATVLVDTVSNIGRDSGVTSRRNSSGSNFNNTSNTSNSSNNIATNSGVNTNTNTSNNTSGNTTNSGANTTSTSPVQTTKYYVNAPSGANLRSAPNSTSSYTTQSYGTVLNVSGETSGFYNIYNTSNTSIIGYIAKDLLTLGSFTPAQSGASFSTSTTSGKVIISSITPFVVSDGVSLTINYQVEKNTNISSKEKFELLCNSNIKGVSYASSITPDGQKVNSGSYSTSIYLNKGFETGNQECYIRYADDVTNATKWSNKITTKFIGVKSSDYFKLNRFVAFSGKPLEANLNFTSLATFTADIAPTARCQKDGVFVNSIDSKFSNGIFKASTTYNELLKFPYSGVYYCVIQFNYLGNEFITDFLGVTIK